MEMRERKKKKREGLQAKGQEERRKDCGRQRRGELWDDGGAESAMAVMRFGVTSLGM
jgi:hypothetical protein